MKVVVTGWRGANHRHWQYVREHLYGTRPHIEVIGVGDAKGVDALTFQWAIERHVQVQVFEANWDMYGSGAGPERNRRMLDTMKPDLVLAFPHRTQGSGTMGCVAEAVKRGIRVEIHPLKGVDTG